MGSGGWPGLLLCRASLHSIGCFRAKFEPGFGNLYAGVVGSIHGETCLARNIGPFFTYLGVLIAILAFFMTTERTFHRADQATAGWCCRVLSDWVGFEMIRATFIPLVATSAFIGYTQATQAWVIQPVSIFSVYGMNMVIMLVNYAPCAGTDVPGLTANGSLPTALVESRLARNWLVVTGVVLAAWIGTSLVILNTAPKDAPTVRVAAIALWITSPCPS